MTSLIGQANAETLLARAISRQKVGHAYLFLGPSGSGKFTTAQWFARAVNCARQPAIRTNPTTGTVHLAPCGECESCRFIQAGTHPEVMTVRPESKTKQNITVEQAREIRNNASLRPKLGRRRMYLIPNAETFNDESANALLKTLEEPSDFVTLILCAPNPSQVLPTIRSRCQIVRFGLARTAEITDALMTAAQLPEATARSLASACGGRPGLALSWAQTPAVLEQRKAVIDVFLRALSAQREAAGNPAYGVLAFRFAEQFLKLAKDVQDADEPKAAKGAKGRKDTSDAEPEDDVPARPVKVIHRDNLETGLTVIRDLLLLAEGADPQLAQNQDRLPELLQLAPHVDLSLLVDAAESVREAQQILDRNVQPQLVLERMFWALISGRIPVSETFYRNSAR